MLQSAEEFVRQLRDGAWSGAPDAVALVTARDAAVRAEEREALLDIKRMVDKQAEDRGLWFIAQFASEAYLQQELRALHALIERVTRARAPSPAQEVTS